MPGPDNDDPDRFILRLIAALLVATVAAPILLIAGRGVMCIYRGGCPIEEVQVGMEYLLSLLATVVALFFGVRGKK